MRIKIVVKSKKIKNFFKSKIKFLPLILLFLYFLLAFSFKKPIIEPRWIACYDYTIPVDSLEFFSNSGCYYSWHSYLFFRPIALLSSFYPFFPVCYFLIFLLINFFVIFRISKHLSINYYLLLFFSLLLFDVASSTENFIMFTLVNVSLLFFLQGSRRSLFFSGLFIGLSSFKPQQIVFGFSLFISLLMYMKLSKKRVINSLFFLSGLCLVLGFSFLMSTNMIRASFYHIFNRAFDFSFNLRFFIFFCSLFYAVFSKSKTNTYWAFIISFPIIALSASYNGAGSRFLDFFALIPCIILLKEIKNVKFFYLIFILVFISNLISIIYSLIIYYPYALFNNQFLLINNNTVILSDLVNNDNLIFNYKLFPFIDPFLYMQLVNTSFVSKSYFKNELNDFINSSDINLIIIGPYAFESSLSIGLDFYNNSTSIVIPNLEHSCASCRHFANLFFKNKRDYYLYLYSLINYWNLNRDLLCNFSPYYYKVAFSILFNYVYFPSCHNKFDWFLIFDRFKGIVYNVISFIVLLVIIFYSIFKKNS